MEKLNKYHGSKIYGLYSKDTNQLIYIGSTYDVLSKRFYKHKYDAKKHSNQKIYKFINEKIEFENVKIVLIENIKCENREELHKIEQHHIQNYKNEIYNTKNAFGIDKEKETNRIKKYNEKYYENNKESLIEYQKEYYDNNKEKIQEYNKNYQIVNKEKLNEYNKNYQIVNKEKLNEYIKNYQNKNKEKYSCVFCNYNTHNKTYFNNHCKTQKHLKNIENINVWEFKSI